MFIKTEDYVARIAPSDSYCLVIERMDIADDMIEIKLTVSGETRTICRGSYSKELYAFFVEEINRFHECFMEEIHTMRMGVKPPASETEFVFRSFYEAKLAKLKIEDKIMEQLKAIEKEEGVFCIKAKRHYICSGCGAELLNHMCSPYPSCPSCDARIFWFGDLKNRNANAEEFADPSYVTGYVIQARYKPFVCNAAIEKITKIMTTECL